MFQRAAGRLDRANADIRRDHPVSVRTQGKARPFRLGFLFTLACTLNIVPALLAGERTRSDEEPALRPPPADEKNQRIVIAKGQITDPNGMGIRGVAVTARLANADSDSPPLATAATDTVGDFTLEAEEPVSGEILFNFSKSRFTDFSHRARVEPGAAPLFIAEVLRGNVAIRGRVTDARSDDPIRDAAVTVRAQQDERDTTTDDDGRFLVEGLSPGQGEVSVEAKGFGRERRGIASLDDAGEVDVRLKPERIVSLKILNDEGKPISGTVIEVIDQQRDDLHGATSNGDGAATLRGVHFDARTLQARLNHPDHVSSEFFDRRLDLPPDQVESTHGLVMERAARVTGRALDAKTGEGIHGARVVIGNDDNDANPRDWTDETGRFAIPGVRPGSTAVTVHRDDYAPELAPVDAKPGETATVELRLAAGRSLAGHIRDPDGKPVPDATVYAVRWRDRGTLGLRAVSNAEGVFLLRNIPTDEFEVLVESPGRPEVRETVKPPVAADFAITVPKPTNGTEKLAGLDIGDPAPSVTLTTLDKKSFNPADMKGKVVVLDFWATWCAPCIEEAKYLAEAKQKHAKRDDFVLIAISRDFEEEALRGYLRENPDRASWHHVFGDAGGVPEAVKAYGVTWIPHVFIISHEGKITTLNARRDDLVQRIDAALAAKDGKPAP